jgi:Sulfotransferase family
MSVHADVNGLYVDALVEAATAATGLEDFGDGAWREGLERLVDALRTEAALSERGVASVARELKYYLIARLGVVAYRREHPQVAEADVVPPVVIVGQARTGTTILHDLLAQDTSARVPLTWEVERPCPPPEAETYATDPRIAAVDARIGAVGRAMPELFGMHPMGAQLSQECVCITASDFRSILFATQYRIPSYARWLFDEADLAPAYRWHRHFLQHLQARHPARRWVLKSPGHIWSLGALLAEYPGAQLVQTHRDPLRIIASVASMYLTLRGATAESTSVEQIAAEWADYILEGLDRSVTARQNGTVPAEQVMDVTFREFLADPLGTVRSVYDRFGMELTPETEGRMRAFHDQNPQDKHGGHRYTFAATGLDEGELRERARRYQDYFNVPSEALG